MKSKIISLLGLSVLILVMFMSFGSATIDLSGIPTTLSQSGGSFDINVSSNETETITLSTNPATIKDINGKEITFNFIPSFVDLSNNSLNVTINYTVPTGFDFFGKIYSTILIADGDVSPENVTKDLNFAETSFCEWDDNEGNETGDLGVKIRISVEKGFGEDEEWFPLDEVEIEIEVKNRNNDDYDIDDIVVEWGLFNKETGEWTIEVSDEKDFNLKDGDEKTIILNFKLEDLDEDFEDLENGDFVFYVRATGEVDDDDGRYDSCISKLKPIEIMIEDNFVILDDFQFSETVSCKDNVQITVDVWNIGDSDQDDVYVMVYNKDLGINEKIEIGDIDKFEDEKLVFEFQVPEDAEEKWHTLKFTVYDEDDDVYENDNDDKAEFSLPIKVEGNCAVGPQVVVSASLESGGKAGQELVIKATVTNTGSKLVTYELNAAEYADWAELVGVEPSTIILNAGQSADVLITFNVNKDVSGDKLFNIEVLLEDEPVVTQPVSVVIEKSGFDLTGDIISEGNWYLWGIGALNVILIIIIILVALRVARK